MENQENLKTEIVEGLKEILKESLPHCKESPYVESFREINKRAYECLKRVERLSVEKLV